MKILIFCYSILLLGKLNAQNNENEFENKTLIGSYFSLDKNISRNVKNSLSYSTGLNLIFPLKKKSRKLSIGVQFSDFTYKKGKFFESKNPLSDTFSVTKYRSNFIDLPLKLSRDLFNNNEMRIYFMYGLSLSNFIKYDYRASYYKTDSEQELYSDDFKKRYTLYYFLIGFSSGLGVEINLRNDFSISLEPEIKVKFTPEIMGPDPFASAGVIFSLRKKIP